MMFTKSNCLVVVLFILLKVVLISSLPTHADNQNHMKNESNCRQEWGEDIDPSNCSTRINDSSLEEMILKNLDKFRDYFNQPQEIDEKRVCMSKCENMSMHLRGPHDKKISKNMPMQYDKIADSEGKLPVWKGYYIVQTKNYGQNLKQKICNTTNLTGPSCMYMNDTEFRNVVMIDCRKNNQLIVQPVPFSVGCTCCPNTNSIEI